MQYPFFPKVMRRAIEKAGNFVDNVKEMEWKKGDLVYAVEKE